MGDNIRLRSGSGHESMDGDFWLELSRENILGMDALLMRGHNPDQTIVSGFVDVTEHGNLVYLTSAETMSIVSDDVTDDKDSTGAFTVAIVGLDDNYDEITEVVTLEGLTPAVTSQEFLRVNSMVVLTAGTDEVNNGNITATASVAATVQDRIGPIDGISHSATWTVPRGKSLFITGLELNVAKQAGGQSPLIEVRAQIRQGGPPAAWVTGFNKVFDAANSNVLDLGDPIPSHAQVERSDIRVSSSTDQNSTETRVRLYGVLIDNLISVI